jgi:hypothetical protein
MLTSCAGIHQESLSIGFAGAVLRNDLQGVIANCTPQNASMPIQGEPAMVHAARSGNEDMIDVLHNNGAPLAVRDNQGRSLAYIAAINGHSSTAGKLAQLNGGSSADVAQANTELHRQKQAQLAAARQADVYWKSQSRSSSSSSSSGNGIEYRRHVCSRCGDDILGIGRGFFGNLCHRCKPRGF